MRRSISENKRKLQPKTVAVQNTSNRFEQSERKKRKLPSLLEDEEPVFLEEDDDEIKKKYIQKFRMSYNPSNTNSKSHNFVSHSITRLLSTDESVDVEVQCEPLIEKKDAEVQCITVSLKDAEVQNDLLKEKENTESKCKCQYWDQEFNLLSLMQQCVNTPKGKNKDLNQLIQLCKKLIKKPPAELKNNNNETPTSRKLR
nr:unnamed protein product [Callosobruchus chinensis]